MYSTEEVRRLTYVSKELGIPVSTLLHHSSRGYLPLYTSLPRHGITYYSVHTEFIEKIEPEAADSLPIQMQFGDIAGLAVSNHDVDRLASGQCVECSLFSSLIFRDSDWTEIAYPLPRSFLSTLPMEGWFIAAYNEPTKTEVGNDFLRLPLRVQINSKALRVRSRDVAQFSRSLRTVSFLSELFVDGEVVGKLPPYVSTKLAQILKANRDFWFDHEKLSAPERVDRRKQTKAFFNGKFLQACDKKSKPASMLELAMELCDPTLIPISMRTNDHPYLTPGVLTLLAAAKLFWSPHLARGYSRETYPHRDDIAGSLKRMGLTGRNEASYATTLIRPEHVCAPEFEERRPKSRLKRIKELKSSNKSRYHPKAPAP